jgi:hypothetical protein
LERSVQVAVDDVDLAASKALPVVIVPPNGLWSQ